MTSKTRQLPLKERLLFRAIAVAGSLFLIGVGLETGLRVYHGTWLTFEPLVRNPWDRIRGEHVHARYDPHLGWLPRASGRWRNGATFSVGADGFRSNGASAPPGGAPILALGDSLTFGDEVGDPETWPAQLEERIDQRVLNAGVFGYGIDQAVLRGEKLLVVHSPAWVILGVIAHDVTRTEYSYRAAWKPYFRVDDDGLKLRGVPVPASAAPEGRFATLRTVLSYSHAANSVFYRAAPDWWLIPRGKREHEDGLEVSARLLGRLEKVSREHGARLLLVTLGVPAPLGGNSGLRPLVKRAQSLGIDVLDLAPRIEKLAAERPDTVAGYYAEGGHYSSAGNAWVAEQIAERLRRR